MPSLADLLAADPGAWLRRAAAWDALARCLSSGADDLDRRGSAAPPADWQGADADRARAGRDELCRRLRADAGAATRSAEVLGRHAGEVLAAQRRVVVTALTVHPLLDIDFATGAVGASRVARLLGGALPAPWLAAQLAGDATRFAAAVRAAVAEAARSDADAEAALRALRPGPAPGTPAVAVPPGPVAARSWWAGLTPDERERLTRTRPDLVGGTDGLPAAARDRANRLRLESERDRLRRLVARERGTGDAAGAARAGASLAGLDAVHRRLDAGDAFLLDLAPGAGAGRVVLAVGDPERAAHVVTHVPGTGAGWSSVPEDLRRVEATRAAAVAAAPGADVAAVLWVGYDAPTGLGAAADDGPARRAGEDLRGFQEGLRAGHRGGLRAEDDSPAHLTVVGHSYGSVVTGRAAGPGVAADDVVFVGSPGVGVRDAGELGVPAERVWATTAQHDPISRVPGNELFGTSRGLGETGLAHGANPAAPGFGARVFDSAPGSAVPLPDDPATPTDESAFAAAHSAYWDPGSPGLAMLGRIVAGTARRDHE
ncbi:alpha/beta hydrolase [Pseudonocardia parietis]|uniref:DUF1023 domain-containing protein n=1 Tax=Pseudonocardia parietis TaxID=570936 RepID=A0ABS4W0G3_9PSEU|nr:alpha/beta hydrolase [Pseudonocardia parietis]MBP2369677.1 hypothetical protein [Pseudonocardia parietis]